MPDTLQIPAGTRMIVCFNSDGHFHKAYDGEGTELSKLKDLPNHPAIPVGQGKAGWPAMSTDPVDPPICYYANHKLY